MALACLTEGCKGRFPSMRRDRKFYEGERFTCPRCGLVTIVCVTDDYSDDCVPFLVPRGQHEHLRSRTCPAKGCTPKRRANEARRARERAARPYEHDEELCSRGCAPGCSKRRAAKEGA